MDSTTLNRLDPQGSDVTTQSPQQAVKSSWKHLFVFTKRAHTLPLIGALLASTVAAGFKTILAIILGKVFDIIAGFGNGSLDGSEALSDISKWSLILMGLGIGYWLANSAFLALWVIFGELQAESVRRDLFENLLSRDMAWFDSQSEGISSLLIRIQTQTRELQQGTSQVFGLLVCDVITSFASLGIALYYSWKLTLVLLAILPVSVVILSLATRRLEPAIQDQRRHLAVASKHAVASITAIDLVKVFNGYDQDIWQYCTAIKAAAKHYLIQAQCNSTQMGYISFSGIAMFVVGFWYGVVLVNGGLSPGHVVATFYATLASFQAIEALMPQWLVIAKGMSAGGFLSAMVASSKPGYGSNRMKGSLRPDTCVGDIELTDVSFAYPSNPESKVLNKSSFFFPSGDLTFIVGRSGSGKSTLGNLMVGFYEPDTGDIQIDNQSLRVLDRHWLRENVTSIQQSSILFNETLFWNIAFGHVDPERATQSEVRTAYEAALLQSTLTTLPSGLETNVGSGGYNLSGGQKQRVALARARLRDPPVLILDEITSGLDQVSRDLIMEAIREWRRGKTTIIITHDVSQIADDEFVYVMDNASLVEEGFKRDLIRKSTGAFATLTSTAPSDSPDTPIEINVTSPDSPGPRSPITIPPPARASRVSRVFMEELEGLQRNSFLAPGTGMSRRISWGSSTIAALRMREEQIWDSEIPPERPRSVARSPPPLRERTMLPLKRYSVRYSVTDIQEESLSGSTEETGYIFGGTDRRKNMSNLRLARFDERKDTYTAENVTEKTPKDPAGKPPGPISLVAILKTVWPSLGPRHRLVLLFGIITCIIGAGAIPTFAYCFAQLLGVMWSSGDKLAEGRRWAIYLFVVAIIDGACTGGGRYLLEIVGQAWINAIRVQALKKILRQPKPWFDRSQNSPGRINECLDRNAEEMRNLVGRFVPIVIVVTVMTSVAVIWALIVSWKLTLVALALMPVVMGAVKGFSFISGKWEANCNKGAEDSSATLTEIFLNIRVVRALTLESYFRDKYTKSVSQTFRLGLRRAAFTSGPYGLYQSLNYPLTALVFYYGTVLLAKEKEITATSVVQVVNLLLFSIGTATGFLSAIPQVTMAQATAGQMLAYANMPMKPSFETRGTRTPPTLLPVRLHELDFSYRADGCRPVLRGVSFEVNHGTCLAIVGRSGCGKSTVMSLLLGLYSPSARSVLSTISPLTFAGVSFADIDIEHLRSMTAYVPQAPFLFPATIAENIAYGIGESSPLRRIGNVVAAAQAAGLHDFIVSLPEGYNTLVGDGGQALSGGQAQRLSIARALARKPSLLVLDEPTSALDAESSEAIRRTMQALAEEARQRRGGMAIVVVTHSREMMAIADRIVVLEDGVKVEEGTYHGLLQMKGRFAELVSGGGWAAEQRKGAGDEDVPRIKSPVVPSSRSGGGRHDDSGFGGDAGGNTGGDLGPGSSAESGG
ncbi:ATP-dependent permease [Neonectria punicea]|uniref:ATP-dependent permease n=1 Tax=Neonectria punicea TaxID=979145 RepID=A0ABR1H769_9HYPO